MPDKEIAIASILPGWVVTVIGSLVPIAIYRCCGCRGTFVVKLAEAPDNIQLPEGSPTPPLLLAHRARCPVGTKGTRR